MPAIDVYVDPLKPGTAQLPVFSVGDDPNWAVRFNNGTSFYNPGNVSMNIGYLKGLADGTYASAFQWVDRMNNQHVGSFVLSGGLANSLTWDENPIGVTGANGAYRLTGRTPPSRRIRKVYVKYGGTGISTVPALRFSGGAALTGQQATGSVNFSGTAIASVTLTYGGFGYTTPPQVVVTGDGTGAKVRVSTLSNGAVTAFVVDSGGTGYTTATITVVDPEASATATVGGSSGVTGVLVSNQGANYTTAPTVAFSSGAATATSALLNSTWGLRSLTLASAGSGYTSPPTLVFSGGTGSGAAGVCTIDYVDQVVNVLITNSGTYPAGGIGVTFSGGGATRQATGVVLATTFDTGAGLQSVVRVQITDPGSGYTSAPTVTFSNPGLGYTQATGTAVLGTGTITSVTLTAPGSGYGAVAPTVGLTGGGGTGGAITAVLLGSPISPVITVTAPGAGYTSAPLISFSGGGGSGAAATALISLGITAVTMARNGVEYTSLPAISIIPDNGALLIPAGIESHIWPFLQEFSPAPAQQAISVTPFTTGRRDTSGTLIYDDSLLIVRPRYIVQPTLVLQADGLTWAAAFTPVNAFVNAVLAFRRSVSLDIEIFGEGRLLYVGQLTVLAS